MRKGKQEIPREGRNWEGHLQTKKINRHAKPYESKADQKIRDAEAKRVLRIKM